jgi:ubiquinone/menaquinone biosynthesis C-methylase UbiE
MEFTGERYVPSVDGQIKYEHLHRYALCLEFVAGKSVLDLASGEGYGSMALAKAAHSVFGVDIDAASIEHANYQYRDCKNLKFLVGSCDSLPLPDKSVEVVTSFETIEHHDKHEEMMLEIKRVLKPGGLLIISSPNRLTYSDESNYSNPYHVKELYYDELINLLEHHFEYVRIYGQRLATGSFIFPLQDSNESNFKAFTSDGDRVNSQVCILKSPIYFLALCSDQSINIDRPLDSVYIDSLDDLMNAVDTERHHAASIIEQTRLQLDETRVQLDETRVQLEHSKNIIASIENDGFWKLTRQWLRLKRVLRLES